MDSVCNTDNLLPHTYCIYIYIYIYIYMLIFPYTFCLLISSPCILVPNRTLLFSSFNFLLLLLNWNNLVSVYEVAGNTAGPLLITSVKQASTPNWQLSWGLCSLANGDQLHLPLEVCQNIHYLLTKATGRNSSKNTV